VNAFYNENHIATHFFSHKCTQNIYDGKNTASSSNVAGYLLAEN
jgi:hypothetical protein